MPTNGSNVNPQTGEIIRQEFGGHEITRTAETAVSAAAAQARAQVEAMYVMALNRPRDWMEVRQKLLKECKRPGLAAHCRYKLPWLIVKKTKKPVEGPNVRMAEAVLRSTRNLHIRTNILYDDAERRVGEVVVIDLETNNPLSWGFSIEKTREVKKLRGGEVVLGERTNTQGETVFRIVAEEAQVLQKQEGVVSRILRNGIFRLCPGDILDEALQQCDSTMAEKDRADPARTAKRLTDAFAALGVSVSQLREYLGHNVDQVTIEEARDLRAIYDTIAEGEGTWSQILESRHAEKPQPPSTEEQEERKELIRRLAELRVKDREIYEAALHDTGVAIDIATTNLPIETLRKIAKLIEGKPADPPSSEGGGAS